MRYLLAFFAIVLAIAVPATPAWAHAKLQSTNPAANTNVTATIAAVTLTFNEPVRQQDTTVTVTGPDGVSYSDGAARRVDNTVTQAIKPLPVGAITVAWKTVSPDGDAISGTFAFTNAAPPPTSAAPPPTESPAATATATTSANAQPAANDGGSSTIVWTLIGAALVMLLAGGVLWLRRRPSSTP
jgi:methionine-rich copper-binding protein CopC